MKTCDLYIKNLDVRLKELNGVTFLVQLGIFPSRQLAEVYRRKGIGPSYFRLGTRIVYPKAAIIQWFKEGKNEIDQKKTEDKRDWADTCVPRQTRVACHR